MFMVHNLHKRQRPEPTFFVIIMPCYPLFCIILLLNRQSCAVPLRTHIVPAMHCGSLTACFLVWCRILTCRLRWLQRLGHRPGRRASLWLPPPGSHPASAGCRSAAWLLTTWLQETLPLLCDYSTGTYWLLHTVFLSSCYLRLNP